MEENVFSRFYTTYYFVLFSCDVIRMTNKLQHNCWVWFESSQINYLQQTDGSLNSDQTGCWLRVRFHHWWYWPLRMFQMWTARSYNFSQGERAFAHFLLIKNIISINLLRWVIIIVWTLPIIFDDNKCNYFVEILFFLGNISENGIKIFLDWSISFVNKFVSFIDSLNKMFSINAKLYKLLIL